MTLAISILLGIVALICLSGGINLMVKGAMQFVPESTPPQLVLDNLFRFLAGIYLSGGFLFGYSALNVDSAGHTVYFLGLMVVFSGLGRLYSRLRMGSAGKYFDSIMVVEILLGLSIIVLKWLE
ncbi:MAG: DUF4345 domain-containing protein [Chitinophagaceae bacterium]|nr:DUF4345 domain-containing protein [Chitinophagaceae bacterium]